MAGTATIDADEERFVMTQAVDDLLDALEDVDDATREEAAKSLAALADPTTLAALIQACGDDFWSVRMHAGWGAAKSADPKRLRPWSTSSTIRSWKSAMKQWRRRRTLAQPWSSGSSRR